MTNGDPVVLGVDLGTSTVKVVALGSDGAVHATARHGYLTARPEAGAAEQNPQDWWLALQAALDEVAGAVEPASWCGMGLTAMLPTLVELDEARAVVGPAITWEDSRAEDEASVLRSAFGDDALYRITGQRVDGRYLAPMHMRLQRVGGAGMTVAGAKDVLVAQLTGELLTDPSTAAGTAVFDIERGEWNLDLAAAAGIVDLPTVVAAETVVPISRVWQQRWGLAPDFPVVIGAADSVLGGLGVGAAAHGDISVIAGTSAIILGISDQPTRDPDRRYLVTPLAGPGWGLEMDLLAMGSAFEAVAGLLGLRGPAELLAAAAPVPHADAPLMLPYLTPGEQGALWDPTLTATLHGLHRGMGPGHIGRALLTGVIVEMRRCIGVFTETVDRSGPILLGGGSAVSPLLWQDLADATGRQVMVDTAVHDHSTVGAAMFAAKVVGRPVSQRVGARVVDPRPQQLGWWEQAAARHDELRVELGDLGDRRQK